MKNKNLFKSPFFTVQYRDQILTDTISGRKYKVGKEIIEFANSYIATENCIEQSELIVNKLYSIGFLVNKTELKKITYKLKLQNDPIFGFDSYKEEEAKRNIVFIGVSFGSGNYTSNETRKFPEFFRKMCKNQKLIFNNNFNQLNSKFLSSFPQYCQTNLKTNLSNNFVKDAGNIYIHKYETRKSIYEKIELISSKFFKNKDVPFFIGGDHSITYPIIKSACQSYKKICVIHFDAHTDTYNSISNEILENNQLHHHGNFVNKILKLDNDYVEMQIIDDMLLLKKNKKSITKKDLEKINTQNISKETTDYTIKNEIEIDENNNFETIIKESKKEAKAVSKPEIKKSPSEKPDSSIEEQSNTSDLEKRIEDSLNQIEH